MGYNGEILTYYRELQDYTIHDISMILDVDEEIVIKLEKGEGNLNGIDAIWLERYCRILQINRIMFFTEYNWQVPEKRRVFNIYGENGRYYVFCVKDELKIEFEVSKVDILEIVTDIIWTMASDNYNFDRDKVL